MFNQRQQNNSTSGVNCNTKFQSFYSEAALLSIGGWNRTLSIEIAPSTGVDAEGRRQYVDDFNQKARTSLTVENAIALKNDIDEHLLDSIKQGKPDASSIEIGDGASKKILTIGYDGTSTYLKLSVNVTPDGHCDPTNEITCKFNKKTLRHGYDGTTGGTPVQKETEFEVFYAILSHVADMIPVAVHTTKYNNALSASFGANKGGKGQQGGFNPSGYQATVSNYGGSDMDFLPFQ